MGVCKYSIKPYFLFVKSGDIYFLQILYKKLNNETKGVSGGFIVDKSVFWLYDKVSNNFIRTRTRAYAIHYLKIRDTMKNNKKTLGTPIDGSLPLEVKNLFKKYGKKSDYAVKDISFSCEEGEVVGILGANGAGKSTTLKCITGMIPLSSGTITVSGYDVSKNPVDAKRNFSFVTDNHTVFTKMTGMQYLSFMSDVYGVPYEKRDEKIKELEGVFKLGDSINKLISGYSHGMKQKICMMGSLIHEPRLWLLDEPMLGLDPRTQNAVINYMREYVQTGKTILFSSHNLDVVERVCDRVIIIAAGELKKIIVTGKDKFDGDELIEKYYDTNKED